MNTSTNTLELEVIPPEVKSASVALSAPADKALAIFTPFKAPFEAAAFSVAQLIRDLAANIRTAAEKL